MSAYGQPPVYGYGYPPQYPPPQSPNYRTEMESLWSKMKDMEGRIYGSNPAQGVPNQNSGGFGGGGFAQVAPQPSAPQVLLIPVSSEDEAWKAAADWTGAKQYFINEHSGEIYIKYFDANIPETVKEVYKKTDSGQPEETPPNEKEVKNSEILEQLNCLESEIAEVKKMLSGMNADQSDKKRDDKGRFVKEGG